MIVREAYRSETHRICRHHYDHAPEGFATLGPVEDSRDGEGCEICDEIAQRNATRAIEIGRQYGTACADADEQDRLRTHGNLTSSPTNTVYADLDEQIRVEFPDVSVQDRQKLTAVAVSAARSAWAGEQTTTKLAWQLGYGRNETGTIVRVRDEQEFYFARANNLEDAIVDYQRTAEYRGDASVRCVADLVVDGVATQSLTFFVDPLAEE